MSTVETKLSATQPANPAKGNLRGQTTLAAEIDRWQTLANNLAPQIDSLPGLKDSFTQFLALLDRAKTARGQIHTKKADLDTAFTARDEIMVEGASLFSRLRLGLQSAHGPESPRLREFGLKPRKKTGRKPKSPPPPAVEVAAHPTAAEGHPPAATPKE